MKFSTKKSTKGGSYFKANIYGAILVILLVCAFWNSAYWEESFLDVTLDTYYGNEVPLPSSSSSSSSLPPPPPPPPATTPSQTFLEIAKKTGTDKVEGYKNLPGCLADPKKCTFPDDEREACRPWGHFYDTIYDRWLEPYAKENKSLQFLEIGFYRGMGYEAFSNFLAPNQKAELHSMEIACAGPEIWKYANAGESHPWYQNLRDSGRLHCGDASNYDFLLDTWTNKMKRGGDAPPLMVVVDDGSHTARHMAASLFFWFPRIEPGGIMVVEDIQPIQGPNPFRTHIIPQVMKDVHWCGGTEVPDTRCFPTIQPLVQGVHCEMHICVFVRNNEPSVEHSKADSLTPANAFSVAAASKCLFGPHK